MRRHRHPVCVNIADKMILVDRRHEICIKSTRHSLWKEMIMPTDRQVSEERRYILMVLFDEYVCNKEDRYTWID